jgi:hypothetical protein
MKTLLRKTNEVVTALAEVYLDMAHSALRLVPGRR